MAGGTEVPLPTEEDLEVAVRAWRERRSIIEIRKGSIWYRVISAGSLQEAAGFAARCHPSDAMHRFTPLHAQSGIIPAAYAANRRQTALWEVVLRDIRHAGIRRVPTSAIRDRYLCELALEQRLRLVNICRPKDAYLIREGKRPPDLTAAWPSSYERTRAWVQALYERLPGVCGIQYESHQVPGRCIVLFEPENRDIFRLRKTPQSLSDESVRGLIRNEARHAGAVVEFGDEEDID